MRNFPISFTKSLVLCENILKSKHDTKKYRFVNLTNGLRCLLIENVETDDAIAAVALSVNVGSFSDPLTHQGMAHFLEHMIFMGSEKYKKENHFDNFVSKNSGCSNAYTEYENTTFHYEISNEGLKKSLDIFGNLFISPLLSKNGVSREIKAVHSEFENALLSDNARCEQILSHLAMKDHVVHKFSYGNEKSLSSLLTDKANSLQMLHDFRGKWYSGQLMTLCIESEHALNDVEAWVQSIFPSIQENKASVKPDFASEKSPFDEAGVFKNKLYRIKSYGNKSKLQLSWFLDPKYQKYPCKPFEYLSHIIGSETKGSLIDFLRKKDLGLTLSASTGLSGDTDVNTVWTKFSIEITLTETGVQKLNEVINICFNFVKFIQNNEPEQWRFDEISLLNFQNFLYAESKPAEDSVLEACEALRKTPVGDEQHCLCASSNIIWDFNADVMKQFQDELQPRNCFVYFLHNSQDDENSTDDAKFPLTEDWFGTKYQIDTYQLDDSHAQECSDFFKLAPKNEWLCEDFEIVNPKNDKINIADILNIKPKKISESDHSILWYSPDVYFNIPKGEFMVNLFCNHDNHIGTKFHLFTLIEMFKLSHESIIDPAYLAGLNVDINVTLQGFRFWFSGFSHKLMKFSSTILNAFMMFLDELSMEKLRTGDDKSTAKEDLFNSVQSDRVKKLNDRLIKPEKLIQNVRISNLTSHDSTQYAQLIFHRDTNPDFSHFLGALKGITYFVGLESLVFGNFSEEQAIEYHSTWQSIISKQNDFSISHSFVKPTCRVLREPQHLKSRSLSENDFNTFCVETYYQCHYEDMDDKLEYCIATNLLESMMNEPVFDELRTKKQLGYTVYSSVFTLHDVYGIVITIQSQYSKSMSPGQVEVEISQFLSNFSRETLKTMTKEDFEEHKESLSSSLFRQPVNQTEAIYNIVNEISTRDYIFDRNMKLQTLLHKLTLPKIQNFFNKYILNDSTSKRMLLFVDPKL